MRDLTENEIFVKKKNNFDLNLMNRLINFSRR